MFAIDPSASHDCIDITGEWMQSYSKTLSWNKSRDCCSWDGVHCDDTMGKVIELNLTCSNLRGKFDSNSSLFQFSNLKRLDLSFNNFSGSLISPKFGELSSLTHLDLSYSSFRFGPHNFELILKNLTQLRELDVYGLSISSTFPLNFSSYLTTLRLSDTLLWGILPERVFHLSNLETLDLSYNPQLTIRFPTTKWNSSTSLMYLSLPEVNFIGKIPESFSYLTSLHYLDMRSCNLSGPIIKPLWNLSHIQILELRNNHLEGTISQFFKFGNLKVLSLGINNFDGQLDLQSFFLSSNHLNGTIPSWIFSLPSLSELYLNDNHFNGKIQEFKSKTLWDVPLKQNQLQGPIPMSLLNQQIVSAICSLKALTVLDLGSNNLKGTIPQCLGEMSGLWIFDLSNNSLSGAINTTFSIGNTLRVIKLHENKLEGEVPRSLVNCKWLEVLDLGNNELSDTFPKWLRTLPNLKILSLRSNNGNLPMSLFENLEAMKIIDEITKIPQSVGEDLHYYYHYSETITTKGLDLEFPGVLTTNIVINLSKNRFEGCISSSIGDLIALRTLNLSHNGLEGVIPTSLQYLSVLESLDLSFNKISGEIPQQLAPLTFLEVLNLSHNHLVGCIPRGKQFDTFENRSYKGNDELRGLSLSKDCGGDEGVPEATTPFGVDQGGEEDSTMINWQAVLMGYGCGLIIGLSMIYIMLSTKNPAWFSRMVEELDHKIITRMKKHKKRY
ncbi:hypothetical protein R3W88_000554 [Solanum pinnatisectum]|uniref:Leucine-rich repeat-containing N-terminal plant-type domain-containing protein n=1 Tax=Solanum pinnatisectum TaxID=50273 RepID=A0AAV9MJE0_9SOLN|nr:hypothetical protein R3W88_000554 [Solanum pinnatisectum]